MNKQETAFILYLTGQSAAGKTTLYRKLKRKYRDSKTIAVHDLDEIGVPRYGRGHWRLYRVDELLADARQRLEKGQSTIICGITLPHEVIGSERYKPRLNIHYVMLKISQKTFTARIRKRLEKNGEISDLALWKRANNLLGKTLFNQVINQKTGRVLDTSRMNEGEVYKAVVELTGELSGEVDAT